MTSCQEECLREEREYYRSNIKSEKLNKQINIKKEEISKILADRRNAYDNLKDAQRNAQKYPSKETQDALAKAVTECEKADLAVKRIPLIDEEIIKITDAFLTPGFKQLIEKYRSCWENQ